MQEWRFDMKSQSRAALLTALFGPLGLAYISISEAFVGLVLAVILLPLASAAAPQAIVWIYGGFWVTCIAVAVSLTRRHNDRVAQKESLEQKRHDELLAAMRSR